MSKDIKAFPSTNAIVVGDYITEGHSGMDLRDYFAAKAMQKIMEDERHDENWQMKVISEWAYMMAEAMLEARNK